MANKKEQPRRRTMEDRLNTEEANVENITVAGINTESQPSAQAPSKEEGRVEPSPVQPARQSNDKDTSIPTKKATTIMPKEVFAALQRYCIETETPKHRAIYRFIIDGLSHAGTITENDYRRFQEMAAQLTTTYEKK